MCMLHTNIYGFYPPIWCFIAQNAHSFIYHVSEAECQAFWYQIRTLLIMTCDCTVVEGNVRNKEAQMCIHFHVIPSDFLTFIIVFFLYFTPSSRFSLCFFSSGISNCWIYELLNALHVAWHGFKNIEMESISNKLTNLLLHQYTYLPSIVIVK